MSEAMALERMTQMLAELEGYLTATRIPYLSRYTKSGKERTGTQQGDLDMVGIGPAPERHLLVAECKGYGGPEEYQNWMTVDLLCHLRYLTYNAASNIKSVTHVRWGPEFEARGNRPDEVWIVFPGSFFPRSNPKGWGLPSKEYNKVFVEAIIQVAQSSWDFRQERIRKEQEAELLTEAETFLGDRYDVRVRLLPVHRLLHDLFVEVPKDMVQRRKRYPDTAMEMLRWITRAVWSKVLDLGEIQAEIQRAPQKEK
jgi:hypothetical protein